MRPDSYVNTMIALPSLTSDSSDCTQAEARSCSSLTVDSRCIRAAGGLYLPHPRQQASIVLPQHLDLTKAPDH